MVASGAPCHVPDQWRSQQSSQTGVAPHLGHLRVTRPISSSKPVRPLKQVSHLTSASSLASAAALSSSSDDNAEDEDDGLVVMLKARIENLQGQLARFTNS